MAITCCCGINKLTNSNYDEETEENYIHELITIINPTEVEETVTRVILKLFHKPEKIKIWWELKSGSELLNHTNSNLFKKNFTDHRTRLILSSKQMEKSNCANIFKDREGFNYGIYLPIFDDNESLFSAYIIFYCYHWDSKATKILDLLEKQTKIMFQRLSVINGTFLPPLEIGSDVSVQGSTNDSSIAILSLCGYLFDKDPAVIQMKIVNFLKSAIRVKTAFILTISSDSAEFECQVINSSILEQEFRCQVKDSLVDPVIKGKCVINLKLSQIQEKIGDLKRLQNLSGYSWESLLLIPIFNPLSNIPVAVVCLADKYHSENFHMKDIEFVQLVFRYTTPVLMSTLSYSAEKKHKNQTEAMLQVAMNIFRKLDNLTMLLKEIMTEAKKLTKAERCSVFLLEEETNELVSKVFDGLPTISENSPASIFVTPEGEELEQPKEIRISTSQGIAGKVATTGEILNIYDAYSHPLFYRGVDDSTGYRTRNILCFPIKDENDKVVGVAQLCNKVNGPHFTTSDEELAKVFSVYCCISIVHSLMYKNVQEAQHRNKLANELMTYHMQISEENYLWLSTCQIPEFSEYFSDFNSFESIPRYMEEQNSVLATLSMFQELRFISRWRIPRSILARFILMVKRGYRDPPYHNWTHALSVAHFAFLCGKNLDLMNQLADIEMFSLFVAGLCHDIDHRGTNNSFQVTSNSVLAALYSSEGSVLERHHFNQTICILNTEGCNIFENLTRQEYQKALDLIRDIILATDLAHHFRIISHQRQMAEVGYDKSNVEHRKLLLFLLMTCADLSDQIKSWENARNVARLIYEEFFTQGDLEKAIGQKPAEQMDRERACIPSLQISFLNGVAIPCFEIFTKLYLKYGEPMLKNMKENRSKWEKLNNDIKEGKITANIFQLFQKDMSPFHSINNNNI